MQCRPNFENRHHKPAAAKAAATCMRSRGMTLIELLVVVALVAILAMIGVPSYQSVTTSNRMSGEMNGLVGDLQLARAEAIKRGYPVTVCVSSDGATCTGGTNWKNRITYSDTNGDSTIQASELIKVQALLPGTDTLVSDGGTSAVTFNREGFVSSPASVLFTLHDASSNSAWTSCLALSKAGQFTQLKAGQGACA